MNYLFLLHALSDDDDMVVSGWGEVDDMREELLKDWGELLEKWDGREKTRPSKLVNLCRKVINQKSSAS